jgi:putative transposase
MHLIRSAPIHAGIAKGPQTWPYSSFYRPERARSVASVKTTVRAPSVQGPRAAETSIQIRPIAAR